MIAFKVEKILNELVYIQTRGMYNVGIALALHQLLFAHPQNKSPPAKKLVEELAYLGSVFYYTHWTQSIISSFDWVHLNKKENWTYVECQDLHGNKQFVQIWCNFKNTIPIPKTHDFNRSDASIAT